MSRLGIVVALGCALVGCGRADGSPTPSVDPRPSTRVAPPSRTSVPTPSRPERTLADGFLDVSAESLVSRLRAEPERFVLVNVWSTWCEPCREEMPALLRVARTFRARDVGLVLIAADAPSNRAAALTFLSEAGAPSAGWFKVGSDDAFVRALHPDWSGALPFTVLFDRARRALRTWPNPIRETELRDALEATLREAPAGASP